MSTPKFDTIIIGSGLGGLSCGAYLAKNGQKVLVLEKNNILGGYAASFKRGPYSFDIGLHAVDGVGKDQPMSKFLEMCGVANSISFLKIKYFIRAVFPEHDLRIPSGDLARVVAVFEENFPHEKEGITNLFKQMTNIYSDTIHFFFSTAPMWQQLPIFPFRYKSLFANMKKTVKQLLDKHLKDEKLKTILFANYSFYGLPPSQVSVLSAVGNINYWKEGAYYPKGGNQVIPNAFVNVIRNNNGEMLLGEEVTAITVENNKAVGVTTEKGKKYLGKNIVSNACAIETFHKMVGDQKLPDRFKTKLDKMQTSGSGFLVYLGLDESFKQTLESIEDYDIVVSETYDQDQDYEWIQSCNVEKSHFYITLYSNIDSSLAKDGRFVASLLQGQPYSYWKRFEAAYKSGNKEEYNKEKDRIAGILIRRAENVIPNLSKYIETVEIATPLTLQKFTGNFNGAILGWANTIRQFTPMDRLTKLPLKNLHLSSAWTFPGEGQATTIACGYRLANQLLKG